MLNELRQGLVYNLEGQSGPVHAPIFTMTVEVCGINSSNIQRHRNMCANDWTGNVWFSCHCSISVFSFCRFYCWGCTKKVDGEKYIGQGRSKKLARIQAAEAALRNFIQFKDGMALSPVKTATSMDFTSDDHIDTGMTRLKVSTKTIYFIHTWNLTWFRFDFLFW